MAIGHVAGGLFKDSHICDDFDDSPTSFTATFLPLSLCSYQQQCFYLTADMPKTSFTFTFFVDIFFLCVFGVFFHTLKDGVGGLSV